MTNKKNWKREKKLTRKESLVLESYKAYFPDIEKACEMAKFTLEELLTLIEENPLFRYRIETIRLKFFSLAENTLVSIIKNEDSTDNNKIMASKAILQYKKEISRF